MWLICIMTLPPAFAGTHLEDRIIAVVNSDLIMLSDLKREVASQQERITRQHQGDELAQQVKIAEYMAITKMIERKLQLQEAKAKKVEVSDQEVSQVLEQMKQRGGPLDPSTPQNPRTVRDQLMLLKVVAFAFVALVFLGLGLSGTLNAAFAGYDKVEQNPTVQQVKNKALTLETAIKTQFENSIKSELSGHQ